MTIRPGSAKNAGGAFHLDDDVNGIDGIFTRENGTNVALQRTALKTKKVTQKDYDT